MNQSFYTLESPLDTKLRNYTRLPKASEKTLNVLKEKVNSIKTEYLAEMPELIKINGRKKRWVAEKSGMSQREFRSFIKADATSLNFDDLDRMRGLISVGFGSIERTFNSAETYSDLVNIIEERIEIQGWKKNWVAKKAGITPQKLSKILNSKSYKPEPEILKRLINAVTGRIS